MGKYWTTKKLKESGAEETTYANGDVFEHIEIPKKVLIDAAVSYSRDNGNDLTNSDEWYIHAESYGYYLCRRTA